jgi:hypothetical protein
MKEINNQKEETNNTKTNTKTKKKGELRIFYSRVSSIQQVRD